MASVGRRYQQELLVWGYIREIEKLYKINDIPFDINDIIYLYQKICDQWSAKYSSSNIKIDETRSKIIVKKDSSTAFGDTVVTEGKFVWRLQIKHMGEGVNIDGESPYVGIIEDNIKSLVRYKNSDDWDGDGCQLAAGYGNVYCNMQPEEHINAEQYYDCQWDKDGDILEITLDLGERTISFKVNDIDYGVAVSNIKQTKYRLVLTMQQDSVIVLL